jgi:BASS family bile acid:Na+ symporter
VRSLLAILIVIPVGAVLFLEAIGAPPAVKAGLTIAVVSIGIGPPAALKRFSAQEESVAYEVALNVILLAVAIGYIPAVLAVHGAIFHHSVRLGPVEVGTVVLSRALIPLSVGLVLGRLAPRAVAPISRYAGLFVQVVLIAVVVVAVLASWRNLFGLGARTWLICVGIVLGEIVIGHVAGGPELETRRVLASFSAIRFPALALLLASIAPRGRALVPVILAYVLTSVVLVAVNDVLVARRERRAPARVPRVARPAHGWRA